MICWLSSSTAKTNIEGQTNTYILKRDSVRPSVDIVVLFYQNGKISNDDEISYFDVCIDEEEIERITPQCSSVFISSPVIHLGRNIYRLFIEIFDFDHEKKYIAKFSYTKLSNGTIYPLGVVIQ
ncbi:hypothetical protein HZS_250 [Henneguya salminicola]|nr:hypothetical protein HZS_250 [Henneguya salminicola]